MSFSVSPDVLEKIGLEGGDPGDTADFAAMGEVTSCQRGLTSSRVEVRLTALAGEDGKFVTLGFDADDDFLPTMGGPTVAFTERELEKLGLDDDCECGDTVHLIGQVQLESTFAHEAGGECCTLQITHLSAVENESTESREGV
jgi:hypothetical protein